MGVDYPVARPEVEAWRPATAESSRGEWNGAPRRLQADPTKHLVVGQVFEPAVTGILHRAAKAAGIDGNLVKPENKYRGYDWYDALPEIVGVRVHAESDSVVHTWNALETSGPEPRLCEEPMRRMELQLTIQHRAEEGRTTQRVETMTLPIGFAFTGRADEVATADEAGILLCEDHGTNAQELAELLTKSYFTPADSCEAESYETQHNEWLTVTT